MNTTTYVAPKTSSFIAGVLTSAATGLNEFMESCGVDAQALLNKHGFDDTCLTSYASRVPLSSYCSVFEEAAEQSTTGNFGLLYGNQFKTENLGFLGYLVLSSRTLGEALENLTSSFPVHQQGTLLSLNTEGQKTHLNYRVERGVTDHRRQDAEMSISCFLNIFRVALGSNWSPLTIGFEHKDPNSKLHYNSIYDCELLFNQSHNTISFSTELLNTAMPGNNPSLLQVMKESMALIPSPQDISKEPEFIRSVRQHIESNLTTSGSNLEAISGMLRLPPWTVKRRLADLGTTFSDVLDQVRKQHASQYLKQSQFPITEIASLLGYSEVSALSRAFVRWYGTSPQQWRRGLEN
ncbi:AraC-like transcriptional regulator QhpR [Pseudomonas putida]|uniref:AraC-like transcriptional regulator QhpR n=1 Tax=Pseudomonas putida TaxID=303 RepID=UPI001F51FAE5|nr:AraC family transcriptional regulator [Pseudomonas putida]MCI1035891.1 AraC family transcriptional regulator [Pseudomonas putida]